MSERGSMLPYLGALMLVGLIVLGLALDVALLAATYREASFAADAGAEAGAARLQVRAAYGGGTRLDRGRAVDAARAAATAAHPRPGRIIAATVDGPIVCVEVTDPYRPRILGTIGVGSEQVVVRACAAPRKG